MKIIITFKIFFLIILFCSFQSNGQVYKFTDFDYSIETVTWGSNSRISYFIPINEKRLLKNNKIVLHLETSEVLDKDTSFITVITADTPVSTKRPSQENMVEFNIPIFKKDITNGFIKLDIICDLSINDEYCELYNQGALWVKRTSSSYILLNYEKDSDYLSKISSYLKKTKKLYLPKNPTLSEIQYASYIKFFHEAYMNKELRN